MTNKKLLLERGEGIAGIVGGKTFLGIAKIFGIEPDTGALQKFVLGTTKQLADAVKNNIKELASSVIGRLATVESKMYNYFGMPAATSQSSQDFKLLVEQQGLKEIIDQLISSTDKFGDIDKIYSNLLSSPYKAALAQINSRLLKTLPEIFSDDRVKPVTQTLNRRIKRAVDVAKGEEYTSTSGLVTLNINDKITEIKKDDLVRLRKRFILNELEISFKDNPEFRKQYAKLGHPFAWLAIVKGEMLPINTQGVIRWTNMETNRQQTGLSEEWLTNGMTPAVLQIIAATISSNESVKDSARKIIDDIGTSLKDRPIELNKVIPILTTFSEHLKVKSVGFINEQPVLNFIKKNLLDNLDEENTLKIDIVLYHLGGSLTKLITTDKKELKKYVVEKSKEKKKTIELDLSEVRSLNLDKTEIQNSIIDFIFSLGKFKRDKKNRERILNTKIRTLEPSLDFISANYNKFEDDIPQLMKKAPFAGNRITPTEERALSLFLENLWDPITKTDIELDEFIHYLAIGIRAFFQKEYKPSNIIKKIKIIIEKAYPDKETEDKKEEQKTDKDVISKTVDINNVENLQLVIQNKNAFEGKVNDETVVIIPFGEDFIELEIVDKENRATQINMSYITSIDNRRADRITLTAEKSGKIPVKKVIAAIKHKKDEPIIIRVSFSDKMGSLIDVQYPVYPAVKGIAVMTSKDSMREIDKLDKESGIDPLSKTQAIDPAELKKIEDLITSDTGEFDTEVLAKVRVAADDPDTDSAADKIEKTVDSGAEWDDTVLSRDEIDALSDAADKIDIDEHIITFKNITYKDALAGKRPTDLKDKSKDQVNDWNDIWSLIKNKNYNVASDRLIQFQRRHRVNITQLEKDIKEIQKNIKRKKPESKWDERLKADDNGSIDAEDVKQVDIENILTDDETKALIDAAASIDFARPESEKQELTGTEAEKINKELDQARKTGTPLDISDKFIEILSNKTFMKMNFKNLYDPNIAYDDVKDLTLIQLKDLPSTMLHVKNVFYLIGNNRDTVGYKEWEEFIAPVYYKLLKYVGIDVSDREVNADVFSIIQLALQSATKDTNKTLQRFIEDFSSEFLKLYQDYQKNIAKRESVSISKMKNNNLLITINEIDYIINESDFLKIRNRNKSVKRNTSFVLCDDKIKCATTMNKTLILSSDRWNYIATL